MTVAVLDIIGSHEVTTFLHELVFDLVQVSVEEVIIANLSYCLVHLMLLMMRVVLVQAQLQGQIGGNAPCCLG